MNLIVTEKMLKLLRHAQKLEQANENAARMGDLIVLSERTMTHPK